MLKSQKTDKFRNLILRVEALELVDRLAAQNISGKSDPELEMQVELILQKLEALECAGANPAQTMPLGTTHH